MTRPRPAGQARWRSLAPHASAVALFCDPDARLDQQLTRAGKRWTSRTDAQLVATLPMT